MPRQRLLEKCFAVLLVFFASTTVFGGNVVRADEVCGEKAVEKFNEIFTGEWGSIRKWPSEIRVHLSGPDRYNEIAKNIVDHYAQEYDFPIIYSKDTVNFLIINTKNFPESLIVNGERIFSILYNGDALQIYRYIREVILTKTGISNPVAYIKNDAVNAVIVVDIEKYNENEVKKILNTLVVHALFSNNQLNEVNMGNNLSQKKSVFSEMVALDDVSECDKRLLSMYMSEKITAGMTAEDVKSVFLAD